MKFKLVRFFFLWVSIVSGQYKQLLHKPYKDKVKEIGILYANTIDKGAKDSLFITSYTDEMRQWALTNNDKELALEAELLKGYANWHIFGYKYPELVEDLIDLVEKAKIEQVLNVEERAIQVIATHYWRVKNYEKAFEWLLQSAKLLEKMKPESFPNMARHLNFIAECHYFFRDYNSALIYFEKTSKLKRTEFNVNDVLSAINTLGLCYQKLGELKLAKPYFLEVINNNSQFQSAVWKGIAYGNLGYNYYLEGNYEEAIPLFQKDIKEALIHHDFGLAAGSTTPLADIYLKQNKFAEAKFKIDEARQYIQLSKQTDRLRKLYPIMSKWYAANNQVNLSTAYLDSTMIAINEYNKKYNSLKLLRANQKVEARERELEVRNLKSESQLKLTQRNFIISLIGVLLLCSIFAFWFRNKYLLRKQEIKELALQNSEKALSNAKIQLQNLTLKIRQDNNLIDELQKVKDSKNNLSLLSELKAKNILTQNDWNQFQQLFNEVYSYFIPSLTNKYPNLSQAEVRCLCLEKLKLSNNEMGLVLGISTNTIRVTKHRIRKKLDLLSQETLEELVQKIE
tara:strand:+ start:7813 stop:9516 length:1704 start_codon:yes stop_codon:yes gene_type:complete